MPDELLMRQVPQDLTAEQSLLGAMLVDPNCIPEVIEQVRADDFYAEENKRSAPQGGCILKTGAFSGEIIRHRIISA